jgi:hypothetical protein
VDFVLGRTAPSAVEGRPGERLCAFPGTVSFRETLLICLAAAAIFVTTVAFLTPYGKTVDSFGDNSGYISIAVAIRKWDFQNIFVKHFWGLSYAIAAVSSITGLSERTSLLVICWTSSLMAVMLAYQLWGGWIAAAFSLVNFDWYQRSYLGGSEPLFVVLLFGSFLAIRRERWALAALLAALATITRPLGIFLLLGIGLTLLWRHEWRRFAAAAAIGLVVGTLYVIPLALYLHDPLATVHSYESAQASAAGPLFGIPFYAIIKGTILYPSPLTNLLLTFGWILIVLVATAAMIATENFRSYARTHPPEIIFVAPYLLSLFCYNYPHWARGNFPRFAIPIIPFLFLALWRWIPKDRRILWTLAPITAVLAASSAVGIRNLARLLRTRL